METTQDDTSFIRNQIPILESNLDAMRQEGDRAKLDSLLTWISPTEFSAQQSDIMTHRQEDTGQWFLDAPEFLKWLSEPKQTLFCPGIPGAGKTMMAAITINHLLSAMQNSTNGVAYVYCNYKLRGTERQSVTGVLSAILQQLVQARPSARGATEQLQEKYAKQQNKPPAMDIVNALQATAEQFSVIYLVVDALDEYSEWEYSRRELLTQLRALQKQIDLRVLVTSRFLPGIVEEFREDPRVEIRANPEDIKRFIAGQIHRLPNCIQRDAMLQQSIQDTLVEAVDGM